MTRAQAGVGHRAEGRDELVEALHAFSRGEGPDRARTYAQVIDLAFERWPTLRSTPRGAELARRRRTVAALLALRGALVGLRRTFASPGGRA